MPKFRGYCLPLESAVEFDVDAVNRLETNRGIKWQVTGTYEGYRLSVFTNETNGLSLKKELDSPPLIFDAEVSYLTAEEAPFMVEEIPIIEPPVAPLTSGSGDIEFVVDVPKSPKKQRRPPHCSNCGERGHNKRTCGRHEKNAEEVLEAEPPTEREKTYELPILFKIFVPSTKADNEVISETEFSQRIKVTEDFLTMLFGGKTTIIGTGNYEMKSGGWADETVAVVEAYATVEAYENSRDILEAFIEGKLNEWEQESIGYVFEDESLHLFGAEDEEIVEYEPDITVVGDIPVNTNSYVIPKNLYYEMMDLIPDTVTTAETTDGTSMILGFFDFDADIVTSIANLPPIEAPEYSFASEIFSAEEKQSFFHADGEVMNRGDYLRNIDQFHDADEFTDLPDGAIAIHRAEEKTNRDLFCEMCGKPAINLWEEGGKTKNLCKLCYIMHFNRAESFSADEWIPTEEEVDFIQSVSYQNALEHGVAQVGSVMARMAQRFDMGELGRHLGKYVGPSVEKANFMMQEEGEQAVKLALIDLDPSLMERLAPKKKIAKVREFPDLPNVTQGKFRVRFAPNPNAPLTVGHMRGVLINNYYADKYDGDFVLRFDDTSTDVKPPLLEAYKMIPEDIEWLTGKKPDEIIKASDRLELYYDRAKELISLGGAYFCTCSGGDFKSLKDAGKPCPHRDQSIEENLREFDALIDGAYGPGEAVLRAKTDLKARNPALRDFVLFRTQTKPHPLVGYKYSCWPLLDFQSAIDDHELEITHIIRGVDLMDSTRKQKLLYDIWGWDYPEVAYWGRVTILDEKGNQIKFSSSEYAKGVQSGKYSGWDDPKMFTVRGMRAKGYLPQALLNWWLEFGLTRNAISVPLKTLNTLNRRELGAEGREEIEYGVYDKGAYHPEHEAFLEELKKDYDYEYHGVNPQYPWEAAAHIFNSKDGDTEVIFKQLTDAHLHIHEEPQDTYMIFDWLESKNKRQGNAMEMMSAIIKAADKTGTTLFLDCGYHDLSEHPDDIPLDKLCEWYETYGFVVMGGGYPRMMVRKPHRTQWSHLPRRAEDEEEEWGDAESFSAEIFNAPPSGPRMFCKSCNKHRTWTKGFKPSNKEYCKPSCDDKKCYGCNEEKKPHIRERLKKYEYFACKTCGNIKEAESFDAEEENPFGLSKGEREELEASKKVRHGTLTPPKSFKDWSYEEDFEHDHPNFLHWVREEVDEHGDPPISIWGREEMMERLHRDAEEDDDWDEDEEYDGDETYLPNTTAIVTALGLGVAAAYFAPSKIREFFNKLKN